MPTHTPASALIKLFYAQPGAPWIFPQWQVITGVTHGLMPKDDGLLPEGLTRKDIANVESYFSQYDARSTEEEKIKFASKVKKAGKDEIPGRGAWNAWVTKRYNSKWKINTHIVKILASSGLHPDQIMDENGEESIPNSTSYLPLALDAIGRDLFGPEALDSNGRLLARLREPTLVFAQRTWMLEARTVGSRKKKLEVLRDAAENILTGMSFTSLQLDTTNHTSQSLTAETSP
jgi:TATA-binding protein-associated factor